MRELNGAQACPHCGGRAPSLQTLPFLPPGCAVDGRYLVGRRLYGGGDGNTYVAYDTARGRRVFLREFFPDAVCTREDRAADRLTVLSGCEKVFRESREDFCRLWNRLIGLRGLSSLIAVDRLFNDLGTVFAAIEDPGAVPLGEHLGELPRRRMSWDELRPALLPLLSTVEALHSAGIVHGGISPESVLVCGGGRFCLGGFCIERARSVAADLNASLCDGYAAAEQYGVRQRLGPWSDVYALAAVTFRCLTGAEPASAPVREVQDDMAIPAEVVQTLPPYAIDAIVDAFQVRPEDRTVSAEEYRAGLMGQSFKKKILPVSHYSYHDISYVDQDRKPYVAGSSYYHAETPEDGAEKKRPAPSPAEYEDPHEGHKKGLIAFFAALALIGAGIGAFFLFESGVFEKRPATATRPAVTSAVGAQQIVPDLIGKSEVTVRSDPELREKFALIYVKEYTRLAQQGYVFAQSVAAGNALASGSELVVYVSLGPKILTVPDVVGLEDAAAKAQLEQLGFAVTVNEKENFGEGTQGRVASVSPPPDTQLEEGENVFLSVWGEPRTSAPTEPPTVPNSVESTAAPQTTKAPSTTRRSSGGSLFDLFDLFG